MINVAHGYGFTTGTCAAGAARAAAQGLAVGSVPDSVEVVTPSGITAKLRILEKTLNPGHSASCAVKKDAGDDPDVTHGCLVFARVEPCPEKGVAINGGEGVGTVTKPGLRVAPGEAARGREDHRGEPARGDESGLGTEKLRDLSARGFAQLLDVDEETVCLDESVHDLVRHAGAGEAGDVLVRPDVRPHPEKAGIDVVLELGRDGLGSALLLVLGRSRNRACERSGEARSKEFASFHGKPSIMFL